MRLLAISGSLRAASSNTAILEAAAHLAPHGVRIDFFRDLGLLPHFNPDLDSLDGNVLPPVIHEFRRAVGDADALLISTPEYAHGLPGSFKNALDWLVGSLEFPGKSVAVLSPSARQIHARAQLREVLATMSARLVDRESFVIELPARDMTAADIVGDPVVAKAVHRAVVEVVHALRDTRFELSLTRA